MINRIKSKILKWDNKWLLPIILVAAAFGLRLHFLLTYRYPMMLHEQDGVGYMEVAKNLLAFKPFASTIAPGYPIVIAMFSLLPFDLETAARLASIAMDSAVLFPVFFLAKRYSSSLGAIIACAFWATFDVSLSYSSGPLTPSTYLFWLWMGSLCLYLSAEENAGWRWAGGAGVSFAMAYLTRPEAVLAMFWGALVLGCLCIWRRQLLHSVFAYLAGCLLLAGPFLIFLRINTGLWTLSSKAGFVLRGPDAFFTLKADGTIVGRGTGSEATVWSNYYSGLKGFFAFVGNNLRDFTELYLLTMPGWVVILAIVGILLLLFRCGIRKCAHIAPLLIVFLPVLTVNVGRNQSYLNPVFSFSFFAAGACLAIVLAMAVNLRNGMSYRKIVWGVSIVCTCVMLGTYATRSYAKANGEYRHPLVVEQVNFSNQVLKGAANILRQISRPDEKFMCRWGLVSYFAGRPQVTLPKGGIGEVIEYGRKNGVHFIVIDTNSVESRRQELMEMLNPLKDRPLDPRYGLEAVASFYDPAAGGFVVYRYLR